MAGGFCKVSAIGAPFIEAARTRRRPLCARTRRRDGALILLLDTKGSGVGQKLWRAHDQVRSAPAKAKPPRRQEDEENHFIERILLFRQDAEIALKANFCRARRRVHRFSKSREPDLTCTCSFEFRYSVIVRLEKTRCFSE